MDDIIIGDVKQTRGMHQATLDMEVEDVKRILRNCDEYVSETQYTSETVFLFMDKGMGNVSVYPSDPSPPKQKYTMEDFVSNQADTSNNVVAGILVEQNTWKGESNNFFDWIIELLKAN